MKLSMKVLVPAALAAIAGVAAVVQPADAASCTRLTNVWTDLGLCPAPDQNRGSLQGGGGAVGSNSRDLFLTVTSGFGNINGTGRGLLNNGTTTASGPNGSCVITLSPGGTGFTPSGRCNNGIKHRLTVNF
jgi:hypothetical protein